MLLVLEFTVNSVIHNSNLGVDISDLFHKVIADSGSALNAWAVTAPEVLKGRTAVVAEMVGCPTTGSAAVLECLQQAPVVDIVNTTHTFLVMSRLDCLNSWFRIVDLFIHAIVVAINDIFSKFGYLSWTMRWKSLDYINLSWNDLQDLLPGHLIGTSKGLHTLRTYTLMIFGCGAT